jgi:hypothetical protein
MLNREFLVAAEVGNRKVRHDHAPIVFSCARCDVTPGLVERRSMSAGEKDGATRRR